MVKNKKYNKEQETNDYEFDIKTGGTSNLEEPLYRRKKFWEL